MIDPFILIKAIRDGLNDRNRFVLMEMERQRPGYRRRTTTAIVGLYFIVAVLLFWVLTGWEIY